MKHETKFNVGDRVYWVSQREGQYHVNHSTIAVIQLGGKVWERYTVSHTETRAEHEVFKNFKEAQAHALKKQKQRNEQCIANIEEQEDRFNK